MSIDNNYKQLVDRRDELETRLNDIQNRASKGLAWKIPVIKMIAASLRFRQVTATVNELNRVQRAINKISEKSAIIDRPKPLPTLPSVTAEETKLRKSYMRNDPNLSREGAVVAAKYRVEHGLTDKEALSIVGSSEVFRLSYSATMAESLLAAAYQIQFPKYGPAQALAMAKLDLQLQTQFKTSPQKSQLATIYQTEHSLSVPQAILAASLQIEYQGEVRKDRRIALIAEKLMRENVDKNQALQEAEKLITNPKGADLTVDQAYMVIKLSLRGVENLDTTIEKVKTFDRFILPETKGTNLYVKATLSWTDKIKEFFGLSKWVLIRKGDADRAHSLAYMDVRNVEKIFVKNCPFKVFDRNAVYSTFNAEANSFQIRKIIEEAIDRVRLNGPQADGALNEVPRAILEEPRQLAANVDAISPLLSSLDSGSPFKGVSNPSEKNESEEDLILSPSNDSPSVASGSDLSDANQEAVSSPFQKNLRSREDALQVSRLLEEINRSFRKQEGISHFTDEEFYQTILPFFFGIVSLEDKGLTGLEDHLAAPPWGSERIKNKHTPKILAGSCNVQQILDWGKKLKSDLMKVDFPNKEDILMECFPGKEYKAGYELISEIRSENETSERAMREKQSVSHSPAPLPGFVPSFRGIKWA